jgi:hypothetical protein
MRTSAHKQGKRKLLKRENTAMFAQRKLKHHGFMEGVETHRTATMEVTSAMLGVIVISSKDYHECTSNTCEDLAGFTLLMSKPKALLSEGEIALLVVFLQGNRYFGQFDDVTLRQVALCSSIRCRRHERRAVIYSQGDECDGVLRVVLQGGLEFRRQTNCN